MFRRTDHNFIKFDEHEELVLQFYESGNIKRRIPYYYGKVHGVIVEWYNSGTIRSELAVRCGKVHGINRNYSGLGRIELEFTFTAGAMSGSYYIYTRRGGFSEEIISENSILSNINRAFHEELLKFQELRSRLSEA